MGERERERERETVCECECDREREREREKDLGGGAQEGDERVVSSLLPQRLEASGFGINAFR